MLPLSKLKVHDATGVCLAAAMALVVLGGQLLIPLNWDSSIYQSMALQMVRFGRWPYLGSWDQNFPGIIFIHAVAIVLFGNTDIGFQVVTLTANVISATAIFFITRKYQGASSAFCATLIFSWVTVHMGYWTNGQRDVFAASFLLLAFSVILITRKRLLLIVLAGILGGYAIFIRPTYALPVVLLGYAVWRRESVRSVLVFGRSVLLPSLVFILFYLGQSRGLETLYEVLIRFNIDVYSKYEASPIALVLGTARQLPLLIPAAVGLFALYRKKIASRASRSEMIWYALFTLSLFIASASMRKFFDYQFFPFRAFLAPLAGCGILYLYRTVRDWFGLRTKRWPAIALLLVSIVYCREVFQGEPIIPFLEKGYDGALNDYMRSLGTSITPAIDVTQQRTVQNYLMEKIDPTKSVECYSYCTGLQWRLGCPTPSRFTSAYPLTIELPTGGLMPYQMAWRREYYTALVAAKPQYIVIVNDVGLSGQFRKAKEPLWNSQPFASLLSAHYRLDTVIGGYYLYRYIFA